MTSPALMRLVAIEREREIARRTGRRHPARTHGAPRAHRVRGGTAFKVLRAAGTNGARS